MELIQTAPYKKTGVQNMRDPGSLAPRHFFLPGTFCEKMKSAWKGAEVKDTPLPGTFCEKKKSAWKGAEVKDTFLPGTFCRRMKSAWKGVAEKDIFLLGTLKRCRGLVRLH